MIDSVHRTNWLGTATGDRRSGRLSSGGSGRSSAIRDSSGTMSTGLPRSRAARLAVDKTVPVARPPDRPGPAVPLPLPVPVPAPPPMWDWWTPEAIKSVGRLGRAARRLAGHPGLLVLLAAAQQGRHLRLASGGLAQRRARGRDADRRTQYAAGHAGRSARRQRARGRFGLRAGPARARPARARGQVPGRQEARAAGAASPTTTRGPAMATALAWPGSAKGASSSAASPSRSATPSSP